MFRARLMIAVVAVCLGGWASAQNRPPRAGAHVGAPRQQGRPPGHHAGDWLRKNKDLPPDQQKRALESDPSFQRLPAERQQRLKERLDHFNGLPPQQKERVLQRMETWERMTPDQQDRARGLNQQFRTLPEDRRHMVGTAIRNLREMSPEQRQQLLNSPRMKGMFTDNERHLIQGASDLPAGPGGGGAHNVPRPNN